VKTATGSEGSPERMALVALSKASARAVRVETDNTPIALAIKHSILEQVRTQSSCKLYSASG